MAPPTASLPQEEGGPLLAKESAHDSASDVMPPPPPLPGSVHFAAWSDEQQPCPPDGQTERLDHRTGEVSLDHQPTTGFRTVVRTTLRQRVKEAAKKPDMGLFEVLTSGNRPRKKPTWFLGYLPMRSEVLSSKADALPNILAGLVSGLRLYLMTVSYASLIFMSGARSLDRLFPYGANLFLLSSLLGMLWNGLFGRLQFAIVQVQTTPAIVIAKVAQQMAADLTDQDTVGPTLFCGIALTTAVVGAVMLLVGKLKLARLLLMFPHPVVGGFLGSIGLQAIIGSLRLTSGIQFNFFWPSNFSTTDGFFSPSIISQVLCQIAMVVGMRNGPWLCRKYIRKGPLTKLSKLWPSFFILLPLGIFYTSVAGMRASGQQQEGGSVDSWFFPDMETVPVTESWTVYDFRKVDWGYFPQMLPELLTLVFLAVFSCMLQLTGIESMFPMGPPGDPNPGELFDYNRELVSLGAVNTCLGGIGGMMAYHVTGSTSDNYNTGGLHRLSGYVSVCSLGALLLSPVPLAPLIPKFFLAGLYMNIGASFLLICVGFMRQAVSLEFLVSLSCVVATVLAQSLMYGVLLGIGFTLVFFIRLAASASPIKSMEYGSKTFSLERRPEWELRYLAQAGDAVLIISLRGILFFGSVSYVLTGITSNLSMFPAERSRKDEAVTSGVIEISRRPGRGISQGSRVGPGCVLLDFQDVVAIDSSAVNVLGKCRQAAEAARCALMFCGLKPDQKKQLMASKVIVGHDRFPVVFDTINDGLNWCEERLLSRGLYPAMEDGSMEREYHEAYLDKTFKAPGEERVGQTTDEVFAHLLGLEVDAVQRLKSYVQVQEVQEGDSIFSVGETDTPLVIIREGTVDTIVGEDPQVVDGTSGTVVSRQNVGCLVGETEFILDVPATGTAKVCDGSATLWYLTQDTMGEIAADDSALAADLQLLLLREMATDNHRRNLSYEA